MELEGQYTERGYAMAALLVSLAVMSVLMSAALPTWRHAARREKEAELVFRGEQYARAVALFRAKNGNAFPPSIDVLVQGRFLRKKYQDPITRQDFDVIGVGAQGAVPGAGQAGQGAGAGQGTGPGQGAAAGRGGAPTPPQPSAFGPNVSGGIMGVHSKSKEESIRVYQGQTRYDQWNFVFTAVNRPGGAAPGAVNPGGAGNATVPDGRGTGRGAGPGSGPGRGGRGRGTGGQGSFDFPPRQPPPPSGGARGRGGMNF